MFNMFRGEKPDPMTLMVIEHEERRKDLERVIRYIIREYKPGVLDIDEVAEECNVYNLTPEECDYIERKINER